MLVFIYQLDSIELLKVLQDLNNSNEFLKIPNQFLIIHNECFKIRSQPGGKSTVPEPTKFELKLGAQGKPHSSLLSLGGH